MGCVQWQTAKTNFTSSIWGQRLCKGLITYYPKIYISQYVLLKEILYNLFKQRLIAEIQSLSAYEHSEFSYSLVQNIIFGLLAFRADFWTTEVIDSLSNYQACSHIKNK